MNEILDWLEGLHGEYGFHGDDDRQVLWPAAMKVIRAASEVARSEHAEAGNMVRADLVAFLTEAAKLKEGE